MNSEYTRVETLPIQSVCLSTTAKGTIQIEVKVTDADPDSAERKAVAIFDRLLAQYKEVNEQNRDYYSSKG